MAGEQGKAHQQKEQVRKRHPLVLHVADQTGQTGAELETGEEDFVGRDGGEAGERDVERLVAEHGNAEQRQREQDEVNRYAGDQHWLGAGACGVRHRRQQRPGHEGDDGSANARGVGRGHVIPQCQAESFRQPLAALSLVRCFD